MLELLDQGCPASRLTFVVRDVLPGDVARDYPSGVPVSKEHHYPLLVPRPVEF